VTTPLVASVPDSLSISDTLCIDSFFPYSRVSSSVVAAEVSFLPFFRTLAPQNVTFQLWQSSQGLIKDLIRWTADCGLSFSFANFVTPLLPLASLLKFPPRSYSDPCDEQWPGYTTSYSLHTRPTSFKQYVFPVLDQQTVILQSISYRVGGLKMAMVDLQLGTIQLQVT
jgi:hypothetical protein